MNLSSLGTLTQENVRQAFDYISETGRLVRVRHGRGARVGVEVGSIDPAKGHRRAYFFGGNRMTAHLVWIWHHGEIPKGILKHKNGVNSDDRIDNLQLLKKQLPVAFMQSGIEVCEYGRLPADIVTGIYEIQCTKNGRRYVGSAVNFSARWRLHYTQLSSGNHHSRHLQRAWDKHGEAAFVFRVLEKCERQELIEKEQYFIDSMKPAFNSRPNASSQLGWVPTEETRKKMRESRAGKSSAMKGRRHTPEAIARMSEARKGKGGGPRSEEHRLKISRSMIGTKSVLTEDSVKEGRRLKALGLSVPQIAKRIECGLYAAYDFLGGRTFAWVK